MLEPSSELQGLLSGGCYSSLLEHETELRLSCATEVVRGIIFFGVSVTSKRSPSEVVVSVGFRIKGCVRLIVRLLYCFFNVKGCCYWVLETATLGSECCRDGLLECGETVCRLVDHR